MNAELRYLTNWNIYFHKFFSLGFLFTYSEITIITIKNTFCQSLAFLELKEIFFFNNVTLWLESNLNKMLEGEK